MSEERPRGSKDLYCPWWKKRMYDVCHTCPMWTMLERKADGYMEKHWVCGMAALVPIATELLQETASTAIEMNKVRNAVINSATGIMQLARRGQDMKQIEDGEGN